MTSECGKNKKRGTNVPTTFWPPLYSITVQTHGIIEFIISSVDFLHAIEISNP